jgi:omega-amidase
MSFRVSIVQRELAWQDAAANRDSFAKVMAPLAGQTDLVVLPEMFTTGFTMQPEKFAEAAHGPTRDWLRAQAKTLDAMVGGSVAVNDHGRHFNRFMLATPDGAMYHYDKRHLFSIGGEHRHYCPGTRALLIEWRGVRLCPLICYDLRFPVFSRRRPGLDYDLLIYVASWPDPRREHWVTLLKGRAIENLAHCVGVNRLGDDPAHHYAGDSVVLDYMGRPLIELGDQAGVATVTIDLEAQRQWRDKFPAHLDADVFSLE